MGSERDGDWNCAWETLRRWTGEEKFYQASLFDILCKPLYRPLRKSTEKVLFKKKLLKLDLCFDSVPRPYHRGSNL